MRRGSRQGRRRPPKPKRAHRKSIIADEGAIAPLVDLLRQGSEDGKANAGGALWYCAYGAAGSAALREAGAIAPLVELLDGKEGPEAQEEAAGAILALADHEGNRLAITESGGIGWLVLLLGCDNPRARVHAEGALVRLSIENANRVLIIKQLVSMLYDKGTAAQEQAAAALANLSRKSEANRNSIVAADGITPILALIDSDSSKARENAVSAITNQRRRTTKPTKASIMRSP